MQAVARIAYLSRVSRVAACIEAIDELEPAEDSAQRAEREHPKQWMHHAKFGAGVVVGREDDKLRIRFADGSERVFAARYLTPLPSEPS